MSNRKPPRYVPTLTEVVGSAAEPKPAAVPGVSQGQMIERVMQRIDLTLERRLREAIAATVLEQTRSIAPMLREEIEAVVRETVSEAFADELAAKNRRPNRPE
jgi:hypothetical protein